MAIRWIINGYFRSGTTFLWDRFHRATKGGVLCLYEPLHPDLHVFLENDGQDKSGRRLHHLDLWSDYLRIPPGKRQQLLKCHPNRSGNCNWSWRELADYLEILHSLDKDVLIQANRLHYHLINVIELTGARVVHLVRNPVDVFHSIRNAYFTNAGQFRGFARRLAYPFRGNHAFETVHWMNRAINVFPQISTALKNRPKGLLPCFVPAWIGANHSAIQSVYSQRGMVCVYEELLLNPVKFAEDLQRHLGTLFPITMEGVSRTSEKRKYSEDWRRFHTLLEFCGLEYEWSAIKDVVEARKVEW